MTDHQYNKTRLQAALFVQTHGRSQNMQIPERHSYRSLEYKSGGTIQRLKNRQVCRLQKYK
jgi:hypothetical protein